MSRTARVFTKTNTILIAVVIALFGVSTVIWRAKDSSTSQNTNTTATDSKPAVTTYVSYQGEDDKTALELLKANADAKTETSSLGEYVTAINGNDGGGTKYWLFYIDGKESVVGAGAYITKNGELIEWKLQ